MASTSGMLMGRKGKTVSPTSERNSYPEQQGYYSDNCGAGFLAESQVP
eukprot:CAMPEP_0113961790 /NCGR_PEP_ID=MMETSP0011_2-20120614/5526_1 /TAXON_ID=101924 /ORGANISM="Rhodosorus marinus" /LENGTH=47 /DNA_ID=CAMNT_0000973513 /DNA_START=342 /DNA_END=485 /DNA_ORIENTATION=- /assembly_acc=CAM_ASM_000156